MPEHHDANRAGVLTWPPSDDGGLTVVPLGEQAIPQTRANDSRATSKTGAAVVASVDQERADLHDTARDLELPVRPLAVDERRDSGRDHAPASNPRSEQTTVANRRGWSQAHSEGPIERVDRMARRAAGSLRRVALGRWITLERAALLVLALAAVGEAVFIGVRTRHDGASAPPAPARAQGPVATGTAGHSAAATRSVAPPTAPSSGRLVVNSVPTGGGVRIDGRRIGTTPVTMSDLAPGDHTVVVESLHGTVQQQVHVTAGQEVAVIVPLAAAATRTPPAAGKPASEGWLTVNAPVEVRVYEDDRLVGTSAMARVALEPGRHNLAFANDEIGYRKTQPVTVTPGKATTVDLDMPKRPVAINALPWAEVWVDGTQVGETPIGHLALALGPHVVRFRHPDLGERTARLTVSANEPARLSVDLRK